MLKPTSPLHMKNDNVIIHQLIILPDSYQCLFYFLNVYVPTVSNYLKNRHNGSIELRLRVIDSIV